MKYLFLLVLISLLQSGCAGKKGSSEKEDRLYSRHLQRYVTLTILNTPVPDDRSQLNLFLFNDGQDLKELQLKRIIDSLWKSGTIKPCVIVGVHAGDRMQEYGVADFPDYMKRGSKAKQYSEFFNDELYPYIKKMSGVRKFNSVSFAGWSLGGLSAFDIGWAHSDKIDNVGIFSGSFWWRDKDAADSNYSDDKNRIVLNKMRASRKKPATRFWFYSGFNEEKDDRDHDSIPDVVDDTRDLVTLLKSRVPSADQIQLTETKEGKHDLQSWAKVIPQFLVWAIGK